MNRQTSLNHNQVHIDDGGKARFVIAPKDPGVPNWLDNGVGRRGFLHYRWFRPEQSFPEPLAQLITLSGVRQRLHEMLGILAQQHYSSHRAKARLMTGIQSPLMSALVRLLR